MNKMNTLLLAVTVSFAFTNIANAAQECAKIDEAGVTALFDRWNASLKTLDAEKVTANYAKDAVLLATISNKPRTNHAEIKDYFIDLMPRTPTAAIDTRTIKIDCNTALDFGTYTFTFKGDKKVPARFTFVYQYQDGQWLIEHHHSSMMPEKIIEAKNVHSKILKHHHQKYNTTTVPAKEKSIVNFHDH